MTSVSRNRRSEDDDEDEEELRRKLKIGLSRSRRSCDDQPGEERRGNSHHEGLHLQEGSDNKVQGRGQDDHRDSKGDDQEGRRSSGRERGGEGRNRERSEREKRKESRVGEGDEVLGGRVRERGVKMGTRDGEGCENRDMEGCIIRAKEDNSGSRGGVGGELEGGKVRERVEKRVGRDGEEGGIRSETSDGQSLKKQHFKVVAFMFEASIKLRMQSIPLATAATLYHKFFRDYSIQDFDKHTIAATCLYLAGKIEEEHVSLTDVINVCYRILHKDLPPLDIDTTYWVLRDSVVQCEMFLTRALKFQLSFNHPHKYLMHYVKSLYDWLNTETLDRVPIARTAWSLLCDSYHGDISLNYSPDLIAVSVLYLALQCYGVQVPHDQEARLHWWQALVDNVTLEDINKVIDEIIDIYDLETTAAVN